MRLMKRRSLLYAIGGLAASSTLAAFDFTPQSRASSLKQNDLEIEPVIDPQTLEKPNLNIGFVPVNDCAPIAVAYEKGFFRKYGLNVTLNREASWGTARDGIIFGRLDASPVVSGAVTNARLGAEGSRASPLCAAMTLHRHGNAITMNRAMWEAGLRPWHEYNGDLETFGQDFRRYFQSVPPEQRLWAVVLSSSIYEYFVRYLAAAAGIDPLREFRIMITPPPQMVANMRIGAMQAYMVAEPWNTRAIQGNENIGFTFAQGKELWYGHPDRVLAVMEPFILENPRTYRSLVKAMIEACQYCSDPRNRLEVAQLITARSYTGVPLHYTRPAITGFYNYGGFDTQDRTVASLDTTVFFDLPESASSTPGDHSTFLWQSQGLWLMTQAARWGQIAEIPRDAEEVLRRAWRTDLYRDIASDLGIVCPESDFKAEASDRFFDQTPFDPSDPIGYLNQFEIRADRPTRIFMG